MAEATAIGTLNGRTITLDVAIPPLEGRRVHVLIETADDDLVLSRQQTAAFWNEWLTHGPQGPLEDDGHPEFP
jgi:hypothetical protein